MHRDSDSSRARPEFCTTVHHIWPIRAGTSCASTPSTGTSRLRSSRTRWCRGPPFLRCYHGQARQTLSKSHRTAACCFGRPLLHRPEPSSRYNFGPGARSIGWRCRLPPKTPLDYRWCSHSKFRRRAIYSMFYGWAATSACERRIHPILTTCPAAGAIPLCRLLSLFILFHLGPTFLSASKMLFKSVNNNNNEMFQS